MSLLFTGLPCMRRVHCVNSPTDSPTSVYEPRILIFLDIRATRPRINICDVITSHHIFTFVRVSLCVRFQKIKIKMPWHIRNEGCIGYTSRR